MTTVPEDEILRPVNLKMHPDDWPIYHLRNVNVISHRTQQTFALLKGQRPINSDAEAIATRFHSHARFLITSMLEGQENLDWHKSPFLRYFNYCFVGLYEEIDSRLRPHKQSEQGAANLVVVQGTAPQLPAPNACRQGTGHTDEASAGSDDEVRSPERSPLATVTQEDVHQPRKAAEIRMIPYNIPSHQPQGPGDIWLCALENCKHRVHEASKAKGKVQVKEHLEEHARKAQEKIDLALSESRPYLPVSNLVRRIQRVQPKAHCLAFPVARR
ncbi:MAG: hypothetical protein Q9202_007540 [Teloschistes flavicans]